MADDPRNRPSRTERYLQQRASTVSPGHASGDPLAELARLIGQDDGITNSARSRSPRAGEPRPARGPATPPASPSHRYPDLDAAVRRPGSPPGVPAEGPAGFSPRREQLAGEDSLRIPQDSRYAEPIRSDEEDLAITPYETEDVEAANPGPPQVLGATGFRGHLGGSRTSLLLIAIVLGLAVLGTAGAFGYRTWSGTGPSIPPIIKANPEPTKVMATASEGGTSKPGPDRIDKPAGPAEQILSREEEPMAITTRSVGPRSAPAQVPATPPAPAVMQAAPLVGGTPSSSEPRKVHTITIRPELNPGADAAATDTGTPIHTSTITPFLAAPALSPSTPPAPGAASPGREKGQTRKTPASSGSNPAEAADGSAAAPNPRTGAQGGRTAALPSGAEAGHYVVQVSAQRSESEAEASFRSLQAKYPGVLGGRQPLINRADKGDKGIYYRAQIGPFVTIDEANQLCGDFEGGRWPMLCLPDVIGTGRC